MPSPVCVPKPMPLPVFIVMSTPVPMLCPVSVPAPTQVPTPMSVHMTTPCICLCLWLCLSLCLYLISLCLCLRRKLFRACACFHASACACVGLMIVIPSIVCATKTALNTLNNEVVSVAATGSRTPVHKRNLTFAHEHQAPASFSRTTARWLRRPRPPCLMRRKRRLWHGRLI
jgi:hypothetical protein